jgi:Cu+-exporting ATPase
MMIKKYRVDGMQCAACSASVEKVVRKINGIKKADVNLMAKTLLCEYDDPSLEQEIFNAVTNIGFKISNFEKEKKTENKKSIKDDDAENTSSPKVRLTVSIIFMVLLMYVSMGHMLHLPLPSFLCGTKNAMTSAFLQFLLALPVIYVNRIFYIRGFKSLIKRVPNMDSLIAIGSSSALIYGIFSIFMIAYGFSKNNMDVVKTYSSGLYFESAVMILTFVTIGKIIEEKSKKKTTSAIEKLIDLSPKTAVVLRDNEEKTISADEIVVGDILIIKPGTTIAVDGVVTEGSSFVDESALTGESIPVEKAKGSKVISASINKNGYFKMRAEKVGDDTTIARIIDLVENANATKAPVARLADKVAGIFVPVVILLSVIAFIVWLILGFPFDFALSKGISVLVISCPCALGLATPVAITVATGRYANKGVLVKSAESIERLSDVTKVVFDKTGTITNGAPQVTDIITNNISEDDLLKLAASVEKQSEHPLAEAILNYAGDADLKSVTDFEYIVGRGILAKIDDDIILGGNLKFMEEEGIDISPVKSESDDLSEKGKTPMFFAKNKEIMGAIFVLDSPKESAKESIENLKNDNIDVTLLTGDNKKTATAIGEDLGFTNVIAEVLPTDKSDVISHLKSKDDVVVMVGDGINDSPALTVADIGIAMGDGTDIAVESADIVLMRPNINLVPDSIKYSKRTMRTIKGNLFWAFFYNVIGIPIAAGVFYPLGFTLSPMIASACMALSSIFVVTNSLRLYKK